MAVDILFVNLPPFESYYAEGIPHLGMLSVLASLRHHGYSVGYLDCSRRGVRRGQVLQGIREAAPRMVGFSMDTDNLRSVSRMTHEVRREMGPGVAIILGGPASQAEAENIMRRSAADVLVIGEGEYAACEVADALLRGQGSLTEVAGICYRTPAGYVATEPRPPIADLDVLPFPDRELLPDPTRYEATLITGRGCPFRCTFCFEGRMGNYYRHRSPENIVAEVEYALSVHGRPRFVSILDDTFTANPEHTRRLCRLMRERFQPWKDVLWFCEVRADVVDRHPWLVDEMVQAGVARIQIGVESADLGVLRAYKRLNVRPDLVERVVGLFHQAGIPSIYCGFILGGPNETMETMQRTLDFARHLLLNVAPGTFECNASFLTPLPGTDIRLRPEAYGLRLLDPDLLTSSNFNYCATETEALTQEMINNFRNQFVEEMDRGIRSLIPALSRRTLEAHWRLGRDFGVVTAYRLRFDVFPRLVEHLSLVGEGLLEPASALSDAECLERFPTRLSFPVRMEGGQTEVLRGPTALTLNALGSQVFALCSGKLTTREIGDEIARRLGDAAPAQEVLQADVLAYVRQLEENYAILLKDF